MSQQQTPEAVFRRGAELLQRGDLGDWLALCAEDVVLEFPFAPPGRPGRIEGLPAVSEFLRNRARRLAAPAVERMQVYVAQEPGVVVAEVTVSGGGAAGRERRNVTVATIRDGLITCWRDYFNPLDLAGRQEA